MNNKKEPGRFSIKFSMSDPAHKAVIDLLNQQSPRGKAQFIANAVLHYIHCPETPDIMQQIPTDLGFIETIVLNILKRQNNTNVVSPTIPEAEDSKMLQTTMTLPSPVDKPITPEAKLDLASLSAISDTLAAFRRK